MKRDIIMLFAISISCLLFSQPTSEWSIHAGGILSDYGSSLTTDAAGNIYVTGYFQDTAVFGTTVLISSGDWDIYVAKLDYLGNYYWAKRAGGLGTQWGTDIAVDNAGNCYITGNFRNSSSFGAITLNSFGVSDIFIAKLDTNGNWLWALQAGGNSFDRGNSICTDNSGCIYVTGYFSNVASFGDTLLTSSGSYDIFIAKLSDNGNWIFVKQSGGNGEDMGNSIDTDNTGNILITGYFNGIASFGQTALSSHGYSDIFIAKLEASGEWFWARKAGGSQTDEGYGIKTDNIGNCYVTGIFRESVTFGANSYNSFGSEDIFIAKLDSYGFWEWTKQAGGQSVDYGYDIAIDSGNNCYITGYIRGVALFGNISMGYEGGSDDVVIAKIDSSGNWRWVKVSFSSGLGQGTSITLDSESHCYVSGCFDMSINIGNTTLTSNGSHDIFVGKINPPPLTASFETDVTEGLEPLSVQFTDTTLPDSGLLTDWLWDFGDGYTSSEQNPTHTYQYDGMYSVSLTVTNIYDSTDTIIRQDLINVLPRNPEIELTPSSYVDFGDLILSTQSIMDLWLKNIGTATLSLDSISLMHTDSLFDIVGPNLPYEISEGDSTSIQILFAPLVEGAFIDSLIICNNSINIPRATIRLSGTGHYAPPLPPENVAINMDGSNAVISWDAVTESVLHTPLIPDYYLVFYNGSGDLDDDYYYLGWTESLSYTHQRVGLHAQNMFYRVLAYKYYGRGADDIASLGLEPGMKEDEVLLRLRR